MKGVRIYDNGGKTCDRFTAVFTEKSNDEFVYLGMSQNPCHPQGFGQHGFSRTLIDRPTSKRLGKRIKFESLPIDCQRLVKDDLSVIDGYLAKEASV